MNPPYNSLPYNSSQTHGATASPLQQVQQQQIANPPGLSNSCTNGNVPMLMNQTFPMQHTLHPLAQFSNGINLQNLNPAAMTQLNLSQLNSQPFAQRPMNLNPHYNLSVGFLGGQFCLQNPLSQFVQMQMPNYPQLNPGNFPMFQNHVPQGMGPQMPNFLVNQQFGSFNPNGPLQNVSQEQQRFISSVTDANALNQSRDPNNGQQLQANSPLQPASGSVQPLTMSQGTPVKNSGLNHVNTKWKANQNRKFTRHKENEVSKMGFYSQSGSNQKAKGKFRRHVDHGKKGYGNYGATKPGVTNSNSQAYVEKRLLTMTYSDQEIQQWREDRKKNYPSKANTEKKLSEKRTSSEISDQDAKLRRQQLKEILAKQAELGCEVAEIPLHYLSEPEEQGHNEEGNIKKRQKKERFHKKFQKRGRSHQNDRIANKQVCGEQVENNEFSNKQRFTTNHASSVKREPTLLQKLLSADLQRDKTHLLQVFRFMVMNSFFKEWPEKSLVFPLVSVKETCGKVEVTGEKASLVENVDNGETVARCIEGNIRGEECTSVNEVDEEEGEIID